MARRSRVQSIATRLNPGDPEAAGLVACYVAIPGGMMDLVQGGIGTRDDTADPSRGTEEGTLEAYFDGTTDGYQMPARDLVNIAAPFTFVWEAVLDSFSDAFPQVATVQSSGTTTPFRLFYSNNVTYNDISFTFTGTSRAVLIPSGVSVAGQRHWGVCVFDGVDYTVDSSWKCYINGQLCAFTTGATVAVLTDENRIGRSSGTNGDWLGGIRQVRVYDRMWGEAEAVRFWHPSSRDALFAPPRRRTYFGVTAGGGGGFQAAWARNSNVVINPLGMSA